MKFEDILKANEIDDDKATAILEAMKKKGIYLSYEEDIDNRYSKLKGQHEQASNELKEAQGLIAQLQESTKSNDEAQAKISEYEETIAELTQAKADAEIKAAIKVAALEHDAKDSEYIIWKLEQSGEKLEVDEAGKLKGAADLIKTIKASNPEQFKAESDKEIDVANLQKDDPRAKDMTAKDFKMLNYNKRLELKETQPELYDKLTTKKE